MARLDGKGALIIRAGSDIAREASLPFASEGASVVAADLNGTAADGSISAAYATLG